MENYYMINPDLACYSKEELVQKYNEAVETIWFLQGKLRAMEQEYDMLCKAYQEVSDRLYG